MNVDLWQHLDALNSERQIRWQWVRGHAGHEQNERVDGLSDSEAAKAAEEIGWAEGARYGFQKAV
jgi:ribonuclease HI